MCQTWKKALAQMLVPVRVGPAPLENLRVIH